MKAFLHILILLIALALSVSSSRADTIGHVLQSSVGHQALRFFTFQDPSLRYVLLGSILLGCTCGVLGSFMVVRKLALMGDALSHAVLPGVAFGFLWNMSKDPLAIFVGATLAGLLGTTVVSLIEKTTKLKRDAALGIVLTVFFAIGVSLLSMIQQLPTASKSGLDKFLFGQAAALGAQEVSIITCVSLFSIALIALFYKELLATSFDSGFSSSLGLPVRWLHHGMMLLLAFSIVVALQAVGVVLVSALLITPAAAAYLLTHRMHRMILLAAFFGMLAGAMGSFFSFLASGLPTGPFMVLGASALFLIVYLFSPRHGTLLRWWRERLRRARIGRENTLKALYHALEARDFAGNAISLSELANRRKETLDEARRQVDQLQKYHLASWDAGRDAVTMTPAGWQRACEMVRNHRLWELYLTNEAQIASTHVHEDAERIEHVLGDETVRQIEQMLDHPRLDPHGRPIPSLSDLQRGAHSLTTALSGKRGIGRMS